MLYFWVGLGSFALGVVATLMAFMLIPPPIPKEEEDECGDREEAK